MVEQSAINSDGDFPPYSFKSYPGLTCVPDVENMTISQIQLVHIRTLSPLITHILTAQTCHSSRAHNDIVKQLYQFYSITNNGPISFIVKEEDLSTFVQMSSSSPEVVQDLLYCEASI